MEIKNRKGLSVKILENGAVQSIEIGNIRVGMQAGSPFARTGFNIFLRRKEKEIRYIPLTGPASNGRFSVTDSCYASSGKWEGISYTLNLSLSQESNSCFWSASLKYEGAGSAVLDLVLVQDLGLKPAGPGVNNEYYASQYLERTVLEDQNYGTVLLARQNMREAGAYPFVFLAAEDGAVAACTDGMEFYGRSFRETGVPEGLLADRLAGESAGEASLLALQSKPIALDNGVETKISFVMSYLEDHPLAISKDDLERVPLVLKEFAGEEMSPCADYREPIKNLFTTSELLKCSDLDERELDLFFGTERRHIEKNKDAILSFFSGENNHVVLRSKELLVDRPHAHIFQAKAGYVPDENIMSSTAFAFGVFNSHITQGNTNFNTLLSVCTSQFDAATVAGQRIFVLLDGKYHLLAVPSAFEMGLNHCRWLYKTGTHLFEVRSWASLKENRITMDFRVLEGKAVSILVTHQFDLLNSWTVSPGKGKEFVVLPAEGSMITTKFKNPRFRFLLNGDSDEVLAGDESWLYDKATKDPGSLFVLKKEVANFFSVSIIGEVLEESPAVSYRDTETQYISDCHEGQGIFKRLCRDLKINSTQTDAAAISEILPWYAVNALTHYLTPYGLEQFSGAAWGTRDVSQGPLDLLLGMEKYDSAKEVLLRIFSNQNSDGGWAQWWMFDSYREIRADHSHGDVYYWCIIALSDYIAVTGDSKILDEILPYFPTGGKEAEATPLKEHVDRLIDMIVDSFIPGTSFVPFGGGDWNDSLQPVSKKLAERLISSWTVEMNYQAFNQYRKVFERTGEQAKADRLKAICQAIKSDFNRYLVKDGIVAGYGKMEDDGSISVLLHPTDKMTGIRYSLLPMDRGVISGIFTKEQAEKHQEIIEKHLKGPDGARLMDSPLKYKGGIQEIFQRAESSTFFGREIGLMYIHEHIRYAESQAVTGKAESFVKALRQAIPVDYREVVSCGDYRQANCYYSSSDVTFKSRYEADERYADVIAGKMPLKGGWRVYSSGPGIYISLIVGRLLGFRVNAEQVIFDPVMPVSMDGLTAELNWSGFPLNLSYRVKNGTFAPKRILVNGSEIAFTREENPYREGAAIAGREQFIQLLKAEGNDIVIEL